MFHFRGSNFHLQLIFKCLSFLYYVQVVFILFKSCIFLNFVVTRHIKRHMVSRQVNVNNMKSQPYGGLEPSSHTPLKLKGVQMHFFFFFPFTMLSFFKFFIHHSLHHVVYNFFSFNWAFL